VEIAFDGVQTSPRYPGGVALRFARVLRYRDDKRADEADTIEAVVEPYLIREGLMLRTPRGRQATPAAFRHLGLTDSSPRLQGLEDL